MENWLKNLMLSACTDEVNEAGERRRCEEG